jgi:hypothetical protein
VSEWRYCTDCGDEREFERLECVDGHGADCPERICVGCGYVALAGPIPLPQEIMVIGQVAA